MSADSYKTVKAAAQAELVEKRSRFIACTAPADTEKQAERFIAEKKSEHYDAKHNVFAYILRSGKEKYSDDAEPQGTAGMPVLEVLRKKGVCDCVTVVTRYFGGILLGAGGLVRAYSSAAAASLSAADIITMKRFVKMGLKCSYPLYGRIPALISDFGGKEDGALFGQAVSVTFFIPAENRDSFSAALTEYSGGSLTAAVCGEEFLPSM